MGQQRLKGQEVFVSVIIDNKVDDKIGPFLDLDITLRKEILEGQYLGETTVQFDDVFNGCTFTLKYHLRAAAILRLIDRDIRRARYQTGAALRFDMAAVMLIPGVVPVSYVFRDVRFADHKLTFPDRKSYVEGTLEGYASDQPTLPANF